MYELTFFFFFFTIKNTTITVACFAFPTLIQQIEMSNSYWFKTKLFTPACIKILLDHYSCKPKRKLRSNYQNLLNQMRVRTKLFCDRAFASSVASLLVLGGQDLPTMYLTKNIYVLILTRASEASERLRNILISQWLKIHRALNHTMQFPYNYLLYGAINDIMESLTKH